MTSNSNGGASTRLLQKNKFNSSMPTTIDASEAGTRGNVLVTSMIVSG